MKTPLEICDWLSWVKAILVYLKIIKENDTLSQEHWLLLMYEGLSPMQAVLTDMDVHPGNYGMQYGKIFDIHERLKKKQMSL